jgi:ABC-type lipoprotein release transport system permease subunit
LRYDPLIMSNTGSTPKSYRLLQRTLFAFAIVGTVFGVATIIIVYRVMSGFRDELLQRPGAADDPRLLEAIAHDANTTLLMLALIALVAALNIVSGFLMFRRSQSERTG